MYYFIGVEQNNVNQDVLNVGQTLYKEENRAIAKANELADKIKVVEILKLGIWRNLNPHTNKVEKYRRPFLTRGSPKITWYPDTKGNKLTSVGWFLTSDYDLLGPFQTDREALKFYMNNRVSKPHFTRYNTLSFTDGDIWTIAYNKVTDCQWSLAITGNPLQQLLSTAVMFDNYLGVKLSSDADADDSNPSVPNPLDCEKDCMDQMNKTRDKWLAQIFN